MASLLSVTEEELKRVLHSQPVDYVEKELPLPCGMASLKGGWATKQWHELEAEISKVLAEYDQSAKANAIHIRPDSLLGMDFDGLKEIEYISIKN